VGIMEIDIRSTLEIPVKFIRFADKYNDDGCLVEGISDYIYINDGDGDICDGIHKDNIDNLILALRKAKEIWHEK
jgi:hypothetical protein